MERLRILAEHLSGPEGTRAGVVASPTNAQEAGTSKHNAQYAARTGIKTRSDYERLYKQSINDPENFWARYASEFHWERKWSKNHMSFNFNPSKGPIQVTYFKGGRTNVCYNALDRHIKAGCGSRPAILWEGNDIGDERRVSYQEALNIVSQLANWLKSTGVRKGDAVVIYMPLVPELPLAMLACARIGAVHSVVFAGFSAESLAQRVLDSKPKVILTASGGLRGSKVIELKQMVDDACALTKGKFDVKTVLVLEHKKAKPRKQTPWVEGRDRWWQDQVAEQSSSCPVEWLDAEDPLFLLYTSGSTGNPKGVLHTTGGYMVQAAVSTRYVFDCQPGDVYWCTADAGWITGHSYLTYGPFLCGATNVIYEGVPAHPQPNRIWQICEKYKVRQFYTAPTLIRALETHGEKWVKQHDLSSLRILGTVGEPINPAAWKWYFEVVGNSRCPIVDTWWQTETGSILITGLPGAWAMKPGSASLPFFGVHPVLINEKGQELPKGEGEGILAIKQAWPSILRTLKGDHERFEKTYFGPFPGYFFTGDGARIDKDGYFWITGRVDDVMNVSGHRVGSAEVEASLCSNEECVEAAVVGVPHRIKGESIYAYVTLHEGVELSDKLKKKLVATVRSQIGAFAAPDAIHLAPGLPKTRSGKIMRRVLRKIATKEEKDLGDLSTLADADTVKALLENRGK